MEFNACCMVPPFGAFEFNEPEPLTIGLFELGLDKAGCCCWEEREVELAL